MILQFLYKVDLHLVRLTCAIGVADQLKLLKLIARMSESLKALAALGSPGIETDFKLSDLLTGPWRDVAENQTARNISKDPHRPQ